MKAFLMLAFVLVGSLAVTTGSRADGGPPSEQFVGKTVTIQGSTIPYAVYLPVGYNSNKKWPVILSLHGVGEAGTDGWAPTHVGLAVSIVRHPEWFPAIVIFLQIPSEVRWTGRMGKSERGPAVRDLVLAALNNVLTEFHGDPRRVTLTGISLGGQGAWDLGAREPGRFAAIMPISGRRIEKQLIPALVEKDIWVFQGAKDSVVPIAESRYMVSELLSMGAKHVRFTEIPNGQHDVWDTVYEEFEAIAFLLR